MPHAVLATVVVMALPALAVSAIDTNGNPLLAVASLLLAMGLSVAAATAGSAIWMRRPGSRDFVFGDLMLWGWLRRFRAERRLAEAWELFEADAREPDRTRRREILERLGGLLEARDAYTHGHTRRVTRHAEMIAREMGLSPEVIAKVRLAAAVHDVGKIHTPREVLNKPGRLTDEEFEIIKRHPVDGAEMVAAMGDPEVTAMVRHHHERLDGTGYPDGLAGDDVPLGARIISVADTFDAMTSSRAYRAACKHKMALDVLAGEAGSQLDPAPVAAFLRYYSGRRSVAWSALVVTAPHRLGAWAGSLFQGARAGAAPLSQGLAAVGAAALAGTALGGQAAQATADSERSARDNTPQRLASDRGEAGKPKRRLRADADKGQAREQSKARARARQRAVERRAGAGAGGQDGGSGDSGGGPGGSGGSSGGSGGGSGGSGGSGGGGGSGTGPTSPVQVPDVQVPDVNVPDVQVPDVNVPDVQVPDVQVPDVQVPDVQVPDVHVPTLP